MILVLKQLRPAAVVYGAATLQGFSFTLVPALATEFLRAPYGIDAQAFGSLFVPLTLGAIVAATAAPLLAKSLGMVAVLRLGVVANSLGLLALMTSAVLPHRAAYGLLLADTTALGLGFGLNFSAVNELASSLSPSATRSVTIANVLTGLGTAITPLLVGALAARGAWPIWPAVLVASFACVLVVSFAWKALPVTARARTRRPIPRVLVLFGVAALFYAFCEGAFSSWATTFVHIDRGFSLGVGEAALSGFWLSLTGARLAAAFATRSLHPRFAFATFPIAIGIAFLLLPEWGSAPLLVSGFIIAGIACSIVFPYAMSLALAAMPDDKDRVASALVAALMTGEGLGTFAIGALRSSGDASLSEIYRWSATIAFALAIVAMLACRASQESAVKSSR
ncbi:MAG TPA: MFS transporter [Candidatus Dormibacteraeota bacterium]|nr:MFS transporter [Candidatus Dormibacteraeota bacterium]